MGFLSQVLIFHFLNLFRPKFLSRALCCLLAFSLSIPSVFPETARHLAPETQLSTPLWKNDPSQVRTAEEAFRHVLFKSGLEKYIALCVDSFQSAPGRPPAAKLSWDRRQGVLRLHPEFVLDLQEIREALGSLDYEFSDGAKRALDPSLGIAYRVAMHEMHLDGKRRPPGGHARLSQNRLVVETSEDLANQIGRRYGVVNDALWLWYLHFFRLEDGPVRRDPLAFQERLDWLFRDKSPETLAIRREFPQLFQGKNLREKQAKARELIERVQRKFFMERVGETGEIPIPGYELRASSAKRQGADKVVAFPLGQIHTKPPRHRDPSAFSPLAEFKISLQNLQSRLQSAEAGILADEEKNLSREIAALRSRLPSGLKEEGKNYKHYRNIREKLVLEKRALYREILKANDAGDSKKLGELNQKARILLQTLLQVQLKTAELLLLGRSGLKSPQAIREAVLGTLLGALNTLNAFEREWSFNWRRKEATVLVREIRSTDLFGEQVRTYLPQGFDVQTLPGKTPEAPSQFLLRQHRWINVPERFKSVFRLAKQGKIEEALEALLPLEEHFSGHRFDPEETGISPKIRSLGDELRTAKSVETPDSRFLPRITVTLSQLIAQTKSKPLQRIWMNVSYESLGKALSANLHTIQNNLEEYLRIAQTIAYLAHYQALMDEAAKQERPLSSANAQILKEGIGTVRDWLERGIVYPKREGVEQIRPLTDLLEQGRLKAGVAQLKRLVETLEGRQQELLRINKNEKRELDSLLHQYRKEELPKKLDEMAALLRSGEIPFESAQPALQEWLTQTGDIFFAGDVSVQPGLSQALQHLENLKTQLAAVATLSDKKESLELMAQRLELFRQDLEHPLNLRVSLEFGGKIVHSAYAPPGTPLATLFRRFLSNPALAPYRDRIRSAIQMAERNKLLLDRGPRVLELGQSVRAGDPASVSLPLSSDSFSSSNSRQIGQSPEARLVLELSSEGEQYSLKRGDAAPTPLVERSVNFENPKLWENLAQGPEQKKLLEALSAILARSPPQVLTFSRLLSQPGFFGSSLVTKTRRDYSFLVLHEDLFEEPLALFHLGMLNALQSGECSLQYDGVDTLTFLSGTTPILEIPLSEIKDTSFKREMQSWPSSGEKAWQNNPRYRTRVLQAALFPEADRRLSSRITQLSLSQALTKADTEKPEGVPWTLTGEDGVLPVEYRNWLQGEAARPQTSFEYRPADTLYALSRGDSEKVSVSFDGLGHAVLQAEPYQDVERGQKGLSFSASGKTLCTLLLVQDGQFMESPKVLLPSTKAAKPAPKGDRRARLEGEVFERIVLCLLAGSSREPVLYQRPFDTDPILAAFLLPDAVCDRAVYDAKRGRDAENIRETVIKYTLLKELHPDTLDADKPIHLVVLHESEIPSEIEGYAENADYRFVLVKELLETFRDPNGELSREQVAQTLDALKSRQASPDALEAEKDAWDRRILRLIAEGRVLKNGGSPRLKRDAALKKLMENPGELLNSLRASRERLERSATRQAYTRTQMEALRKNVLWLESACQSRAEEEGIPEILMECSRLKRALAGETSVSSGSEAQSPSDNAASTGQTRAGHLRLVPAEDSNVSALVVSPPEPIADSGVSSSQSPDQNLSLMEYLKTLDAHRLISELEQMEFLHFESHGLSNHQEVLQAQYDYFLKNHKWAPHPAGKLMEDNLPRQIVEDAGKFRAGQDLPLRWDWRKAKIRAYNFVQNLEKEIRDSDDPKKITEKDLKTRLQTFYKNSPNAMLDQTYVYFYLHRFKLSMIPDEFLILGTNEVLLKIMLILTGDQDVKDFSRVPRFLASLCDRFIVESDPDPEFHSWCRSVTLFPAVMDLPFSFPYAFCSPKNVFEGKHLPEQNIVRHVWEDLGDVWTLERELSGLYFRANERSVGILTEPDPGKSLVRKILDEALRPSGQGETSTFWDADKARKHAEEFLKTASRESDLETAVTALLFRSPNPYLAYETLREAVERWTPETPEERQVRRWFTSESLFVVETKLLNLLPPNLNHFVWSLSRRLIRGEYYLILPKSQRQQQALPSIYLTWSDIDFLLGYQHSGWISLKPSLSFFKQLYYGLEEFKPFFANDVFQFLRIRNHYHPDPELQALIAGLEDSAPDADVRRWKESWLEFLNLLAYANFRKGLLEYLSGVNALEESLSRGSQLHFEGGTPEPVRIMLQEKEQILDSLRLKTDPLSQSGDVRAIREYVRDSLASDLAVLESFKKALDLPLETTSIDEEKAPLFDSPKRLLRQLCSTHNDHSIFLWISLWGLFLKDQSMPYSITFPEKGQVSSDEMLWLCDYAGFALGALQIEMAIFDADLLEKIFQAKAHGGWVFHPTAHLDLIENTLSQANENNLVEAIRTGKDPKVPIEALLVRILRPLILPDTDPYSKLAYDAFCLYPIIGKHFPALTNEIQVQLLPIFMGKGSRPPGVMEAIFFLTPLTDTVWEGWLSWLKNEWQLNPFTLREASFQLELLEEFRDLIPESERDKFANKILAPVRKFNLDGIKKETNTALKAGGSVSTIKTQVEAWYPQESFRIRLRQAIDEAATEFLRGQSQTLPEKARGYFSRSLPLSRIPAALEELGYRVVTPEMLRAAVTNGGVSHRDPLQENVVAHLRSGKNAWEQLSALDPLLLPSNSSSDPVLTEALLARRSDEELAYLAWVSRSRVSPEPSSDLRESSLDPSDLQVELAEFLEAFLRDSLPHKSELIAFSTLFIGGPDFAPGQSKILARLEALFRWIPSATWKDPHPLSAFLALHSETPDSVPGIAESTAQLLDLGEEFSDEEPEWLTKLRDWMGSGDFQKWIESKLPSGLPDEGEGRKNSLVNAFVQELSRQMKQRLRNSLDSHVIQGWMDPLPDQILGLFPEKGPLDGAKIQEFLLSRLSDWAQDLDEPDSEVTGPGTPGFEPRILAPGRFSYGTLSAA